MSMPSADYREEKASKPIIILAVSDAGRREAYLAALDSYADLTLSGTLKEIPKLLRQAPCQGILIDIFLKVRASHMDKVRIADSLDAMPSATLNLDAKNGSIRMLMLNQRHGSAKTVEEFVGLCASFQPAVIYPADICPPSLNAIISTSPEFANDSEKTFSSFISGSGCFIFSSSPERFAQDSTVWIDFVGISERKPILAKVCWQFPWGVSHNLSGIYVEFESILESQYKEITAVMAKERNRADI